MSNANVNLMGTANNATQDDSLFLKVFSGEVLTSYEKATVTAGAEQTRSIANGKSASFPVIGRIGADYHVAGTEITGDNINHAERVITINDLLLSSVFIGNLEEAKLHYDIRGIYSAEMGRALAFQKDKHVLQTILQAAEGTSPLTGDGAVNGEVVTKTDIVGGATDAAKADAFVEALFASAEALDNKYVSKEGRVCFLKPSMYYKLANATNAINVDFSGQGSIAEGRVEKIAGIKLIPTVHLPSTNITTSPEAGKGLGTTPQAADFTNVEALVSHPSAVGTLKLLDVASEMEYDIRRQGTLLVSKYAMGHGVLRNEAAVAIKSA